MPDVFVSQKSVKEKEVKLQREKPKVTRDRTYPKERKHELEGYTKSPLSAYCYYPDHVNFVGADQEERIVLLLRKHPITNLPWIVLAMVLLSAPIVLSLFSLLNFVPLGFQVVGIMFWYLISIAFIFEEFLSWFFNVYIVTDERVFDVDFLNLTYREISDAELEDIQDVTVRVGSVIRTLFDYGDIIIQTSAEIPQLEFDAVPHPDKVAQVLRELRIEEKVEEIEGRVR